MSDTNDKNLNAAEEADESAVDSVLDNFSDDAEQTASPEPSDYDPTLCAACQRSPREEGSYYCADCRTKMLKTKIKGGAVFAAVLSVIVSLIAMVLLTLNAQQGLYIVDAGIDADNGYLYSASDKLSKANTAYSELNESSAVKAFQNSFGNQELFPQGNSFIIKVAEIYSVLHSDQYAGQYLAEYVGEETVNSSAVLKRRVSKYLDEYEAFTAVQNEIYEDFTKYESAKAEDVPYDELVKKLDSLKGKEGIKDYYLEYYKCYAAVMAGKGYDVQVKHLEEMDKLYPEGIMIYGTLMADCYYRLGEYDKAIACDDKMIARNKNASEAYQQKFLCCMAKKDTKAAEQVCKDLDNVLNLTGTDMGDYTNYALNAQLYWYQGEYDKALSILSDALDASKGDPEIYRQMAIVYLLKGDYATAAKSADSSFQSASAAQSLNLDILNTAALCAGLAKDDTLYKTIEDTLKNAGYSVSDVVKECLDGKTSIKDIFISAGGTIS